MKKARLLWLAVPAIFAVHFASVWVAERSEASSVLLATGGGAPAWAVLSAMAVVITRVLEVVVLPPAALVCFTVFVRRSGWERARRMLVLRGGGSHERPHAPQASTPRADAAG